MKNVLKGTVHLYEDLTQLTENAGSNNNYLKSTKIFLQNTSKIILYNYKKYVFQNSSKQVVKTSSNEMK